MTMHVHESSSAMQTHTVCVTNHNNYPSNKAAKLGEYGKCREQKMVQNKCADRNDCGPRQQTHKQTNKRINE